MKLKLDQLTSHLGKTLAPCYLVSGDEHLLANEALDEIRAAARERGFGNRDAYVATRGFDWNLPGAAASNLSLFSEKRLIDLRIPTGKPGRDGSAAIATLVDRLEDDVILLVSTPRLDQRAQSAKWVKAIDSAGVHVQVWPVGIRELPGWITARMRRAGLNPERAAAAMIADRVEGNLLAAAQEIEKLRLLLGEGDVSAEDVSRAVADSTRYDVYKLVDAAVGGDAARAMRILAGLRAEGTPKPLVIWALAREMRSLAQLADDVHNKRDLGAAMRKARVWSNRQAIVRSCVSRHSRDDFYRLIKRVKRADAIAKGQAHGDGWQALADVLLQLSLGMNKAA